MTSQQRGILKVIDLGMIPYKDAWDLQSEIHHGLIRNKRENYPHPQVHYLLLCEHQPVFTLGKSGSEDHLRIDKEEMIHHQIEYFKINRGGDITFHGPGQLVGYPILDLDLIFTDVHKYVRSLEEVIIRTLTHYGVKGVRNERFTGVWVDQSKPVVESKKICAIGVHLSRWVTMHGFAFNVNTDLSYFDHIVPCGISDPDKSVTSLSGLMGNIVDLQVVKEQVSREFGLVFDLETMSLPLESINQPC
jgi:lipoyl(octanoyl) transferase